MSTQTTLLAIGSSDNFGIILYDTELKKVARHIRTVGADDARILVTTASYIVSIDWDGVLTIANLDGGVLSTTYLMPLINTAFYGTTAQGALNPAWSSSFPISTNTAYNTIVSGNFIYYSSINTNLYRPAILKLDITDPLNPVVSVFEYEWSTPLSDTATVTNTANGYYSTNGANMFTTEFITSIGDNVVISFDTSTEIFAEGARLPTRSLEGGLRFIMQSNGKFVSNTGNRSIYLNNTTVPVAVPTGNVVSLLNGKVHDVTADILFDASLVASNRLRWAPVTGEYSTPDLPELGLTAGVEYTIDMTVQGVTRSLAITVTEQNNFNLYYIASALAESWNIANSYAYPTMQLGAGGEGFWTIVAYDYSGPNGYTEYQVAVSNSATGTSLIDALALGTTVSTLGWYTPVGALPKLTIPAPPAGWAIDASTLNNTICADGANYYFASRFVDVVDNQHMAINIIKTDGTGIPISQTFVDYYDIFTESMGGYRFWDYVSCMIVTNGFAHIIFEGAIVSVDLSTGAFSKFIVDGDNDLGDRLTGISGIQATRKAVIGTVLEGGLPAGGRKLRHISENEIVNTIVTDSTGGYSFDYYGPGPITVACESANPADGWQIRSNLTGV